MTSESQAPLLNIGTRRFRIGDTSVEVSGYDLRPGIGFATTINNTPLTWLEQSENSTSISWRTKPNFRPKDMITTAERSLKFSRELGSVAVHHLGGNRDTSDVCQLESLETSDIAVVAWEPQDQLKIMWQRPIDTTDAVKLAIVTSNTVAQRELLNSTVELITSTTNSNLSGIGNTELRDLIEDQLNSV